MARPAAKLQPKHFKVLELFEEGIFSIKEMAAACKIPLETLYDLFEGNSETQGTIAHLFREELNKLSARNSVKIKHLTKSNKVLAMAMIYDRLVELKKKKKLSPQNTQELTKILNTLTKATPGVEIGSFSLTKGLSAEDLANEFKRLSSIARNASNGLGVQDSDPGESGDIPPAPGRRDSIPEE